MSKEEIIIEMKFGSELYGTKIPESDTDYKSIFIPSSRDILLQKAKDVHSRSLTKKNGLIKNTSKDIDKEDFSLQFYLKSLADGQTFALEMLFAPENMWTIAGPKIWIWQGIRENRELIVSKRSQSFIGYATKQAFKYCSKKDKITSFERIVTFLESFSNRDTKLIDIELPLDAFVYPGDLYQGDGSDLLIRYIYIKFEKYLDVCNKRVSMYSKISQALTMYRKQVLEYKKRLNNNEDIDWKSLMHAVRIIEEGIELLKTGKITFPRPNANILLDIRKGNIQYEVVESIIESGLDQLKMTHKESSLRENSDLGFIDDLVNNVYGEQVRAEFNE